MCHPIATYRLQFNSSFGFKAAKEIVPYLSKLGISDIYASPIFQAKKGSNHGYDVTDQNILNPELGTPEEFEDLMKEIKANNMGWIQDFVPNHMSYSYENWMLSDILERGRKSRFNKFFDIDWNHPDNELKGKLLAPFLREFYGQALDNGKVKLQYCEAGFFIAYLDLRFPLRLKSYADILSRDLNYIEEKLGKNSSAIISLKDIILEAGRENPDPGLKKKLWDLCSASAEIRVYIDLMLEMFNGSLDDPESLSLLDDLLSKQLFRLCYWKVAADEINYRRFFVINDLISLRIDRKEVFDYVHSMLFDLVDKGWITGLRIDHIDGLFDPKNYLRRLSAILKRRYLVVEKVLLQWEELPASWPVYGTTGYDFLTCLNMVLCDSSNENYFSELYFRLIDTNISYDEIVYNQKKLIADRHMSGDLDNLASNLKKSMGRGRYGIDIPLSGIKKAIIELMAFFPIYRTYIGPTEFNERDRNIIIECAKKAKEKNMDLFDEIDFVEHFLLSDGDDIKNFWIRFIMKFQQLTGTIMAKGVEDTSLYIYNRLISLNDVGGDPSKFGISLDEFHLFTEERFKKWPYSMNATSTHDSKRGEDARARINVLSEIPEEWEAHVTNWSMMNDGLKEVVKGRCMPDRNEEYFLYQVLVGSFPSSQEDIPSFRERLKDYIIKTVREAKIHSNWAKPDTSYEKNFITFAENILDSEEFMKDFCTFLPKVAYHGFLNSLIQTLLKMTDPGIPDFFQGTELWDFSFVDPDNRRPVHFEKRIRYLNEIIKREEEDIIALILELRNAKDDGMLKLFLIHRVLTARRENEDLFAQGTYIRLRVEGKHKENIIAFARKYNNIWALTITPRLTAALTKEKEEISPGFPECSIWDRDRIILPIDAPFNWRNIITDQPIRCDSEIHLRDAFEYFPVALLLGKKEI